MAEMNPPNEFARFREASRRGLASIGLSKWLASIFAEDSSRSTNPMIIAAFAFVGM